MNSANSCTWLCGADCQPPRPLATFADSVMAFWADVSAALLKDRDAKAYPDVVTFAFFCRRANLEALKAPYAGDEVRIGRGMSFHIAPSNVPINFAYSLAAALLAGNACIVKASSRDFPQTRIVCRAIQQVLDAGHAAIKPYVNVCMYPREQQDLTEKFSARCDARIIWGGDETIRRVRTVPIAPRAVEITFADRYSLLAVDAQTVLAMEDAQLQKTAQGFFNDTYLTDQNACTSPRLVYWLGVPKTVQAAQQRFWDTVHAYAAPRYAIEPVVAVDKLTAAYRAAIGMGAKMHPMADNLIVRVQVSKLPANIDEHRCVGGFFVEYADKTLDALADVVKPKYQTLSHIGLDAQALSAFVRDNGLTGIDRIASVGHTMDFALVWDGYDLIRTMSRRISAM